MSTKPVDHSLELLRNQLFCLIPGETPKSAKDQTLESPQSDWWPKLGPFYMQCLSLRIDQWKSLSQTLPCTKLSEEKKYILNEIHYFCHGVFSAQLNGLRILFSFLVLHPQVFKADKMVPQKNIKLGDIINLVNGDLLILLSYIEEKLFSKSGIDITICEQYLDLFSEIFDLSLEYIRDIPRFNEQRRAFELLKKCLTDVDQFFPLLLRPQDSYEVFLFSTFPINSLFFSEKIQMSIAGAARLVILGCDAFEAALDKIKLKKISQGTFKIKQKNPTKF